MVDMPGGREISEEQFKLFHDSGLIDVAEFFLCINYDVQNYKWIGDHVRNRKNIHVVYLEAVPIEFEAPTIKFLKDRCDAEEEPFAALYIHHKGIRYIDNPACRDWRHYMEHFNVTKWRDCVEKLEEGYDTVGVDWKETPGKHYSGNFWWARSDYVKKLPQWSRPRENGFTKQFPDISEEIADYRMECEFWLGLGDPKAYEIHKTPDRNPYLVRYPPEEYK